VRRRRRRRRRKHLFDGAPRSPGNSRGVRGVDLSCVALQVREEDTWRVKRDGF